MKSDITGKRKLKAQNVSHSNIKTKKRSHANIQSKRIFDAESGRWVRLKISARGDVITP